MKTTLLRIANAGYEHVTKVSFEDPAFLKCKTFKFAKDTNYPSIVQSDENDNPVIFRIQKSIVIIIFSIE